MTEKSSISSIAAMLLAVMLWPVGAESAAPEEPDLPRDRSLRAGFLLVDGVYNTELVAPWDVLEHVRYHASPHPGIEVFTIAERREPVKTAEGLRLLPDFTFTDAPPIDFLIVPSAENSRGSDRENLALIDWVRRTGHKARYTVSLCWGAFILAEAGLLDGRAVTTYPGDLESFASAFPDLDLRINVSFVHDDNVLTSQGGARSYDVAMYLVDLVFGEEVARRVGKGLLIEWPWPENNRPAYISDAEYSPRRFADASPKEPTQP